MWREVTIKGKVYLAGCVTTPGKVEFNLYDCDECWTAVRTEEQIMQVVKKLNKRIQFDVVTVRDTLQNAQPELLVWAEASDEANNVGGAEGSQVEDTERVLKLKYRVGEGAGRPFHFEWQLKKLSASETIRLPAAQVFSMVDALPAQVDELLEVLRRKEEEIAQYKREKGDLIRSTLATNLFDLQKFRSRYAESNIKAKGLAHMLERWQADMANSSVPSEEPSTSSINSSPTKCIKLEDTNKISPTSIRTAVKESPRSRKRKALLEQKLQLSRKLNTGKHKLEYENSQSQPSNDSQELAPLKEEKIPPPANKVEPELEVESKRIKSPRIQLRSSSRQNQQEVVDNRNIVTILPQNSIVEENNDNANIKDPIGGSKISTGENLTDNASESAGIQVNNRCNVTINVDSKPKTTDELSLYVDSVLEAMEAFDKQLREDLWDNVQ